MNKPKYRLRKGPDVNDYVVETINQSADKLELRYRYFSLRAEARAWAKERHAAGLRVRVFRATYKLVSDTKRKGR